MTKCPVGEGCGQWTDHEEWYHDDEDILVVDYIDNPDIVNNPPKN
jgi:hypothetical protein